MRHSLSPVQQRPREAGVALPHTKDANVWLELRKAEVPIEEFDGDRLNADSFCMWFEDAGGSGPCAVDVIQLGVFERPVDALGFLRHRSIPEALSWITDRQSEGPVDADDYLGSIEDAELKSQMSALLALIDAALAGPAVAPADLVAVRELHNAALGSTNPENQILAWGSLAEVLTSPVLTEALDDLLEDGDDEAYLVTLKGLLADGTFDAADEMNLAMARAFFDQAQCF